MEDNKKIIYPMMIELNETIKDTVYCLSLPKIVKDKWIELERKAKSNYNPMYNLPTITFKNMLGTYLEGMIEMNPVSSISDDNKWLVSFKNLNLKIVLNCFKIWVDEFYLKRSLTNDFTRKDGNDENVKRVAQELYELLKTELFGEVLNEEITLFENGKAISKEGYALYPLRIVSSLMGKSINLKGIDTKLLYSSRNELATDTHDFHHKKDYYSFVIRLSVQTLPPENRAYLNVDLSIRRWISRNEKMDGKIFLPNDKNCYIRVKNDRMQSIKTQYNKELSENVWKSIDYRCFKECQIESRVPNFTEVLKEPQKFNNGKVEDVLVPFEDGINWIDTTVKAGVSFIDRKNIFDYIKKQVEHIDNITSSVEAVKITKIAKDSKAAFYKNNNPNTVDSDLFITQLNKALDNEKLTVEVYAQDKMGEVINSRLQSYFGEHSKHEIRFCELGELGNKLDKTKSSKKNNIPGYEIRKIEINEKLTKAKTPTLALIAIQAKEHFKKLDKDFDVDPKQALRHGFAETGRLTQFITYENFLEEAERVDNCDEVYEKKKEAIMKNGKEPQKQSINDHINKNVEGVLLDGFRQLGVVFDYSKNKHLKGKKIVGVHVINYKKTNYGKIPLLPILISYDIDNSKLSAYCELIDKVDIPYWKAILGLSKLGSLKNIDELCKEISDTTVYRRIDRLINKELSETVIIIAANGTSRQIIKGISNGEIEKADKTEFKQINNLLTSNGKSLDLLESNKNFAILRIRTNDEVPSYFTMDKDDENKEFTQQSGIFKYNNTYYSIDGRPLHEQKVYDKNSSKATGNKSFSHRNAIEIYPLFVSGNETSHEKNEKIAVGIVDIMRKASIQFTAQRTELPLPLHLAEKMEEYI